MPPLNSKYKKKKPYFYGPGSFPYLNAVDLASVHEQAHFVLNSDEMRAGLMSLGDVKQENDKANAKIALITFVSKAIKFGLQYRGLHAGKTYIGDQPRVAILLNYLTKELYDSPLEKTPIQHDQLFSNSNIKGLLVSVFIFDDSLSFTDMLSDVMMINTYGLPQRRARDFANQPEERHMRPQQDAPPVVVVGRPDIPGEHLDYEGSAYKFSIALDHRGQLRQKRKSVQKYYTGIDRISKLISTMQIAMGGNYARIPQSDSTQHLSALGAANPYQLQNLFTFNKALEQIGLMDVDPDFKDRGSWINLFRLGGTMSFGAPSWDVGPRVYNFGQGNQNEYGKGMNITCANIPLDVFRPSGIFRTELPHISLLRSEAAVNQDNVQMDIDETTGRKVNISHLMESLGMPSAPRAMQLANEASMNKDAFNAIADDNNVKETRLLNMCPDPRKPDAVYKTELAKHREEGARHYSTLLGDISAPDLPEGYKALILWRWKNPKLCPKEEPLWQKPDVAMCAYAQNKVTQLRVYERIMETSDSQLFLLPTLYRSSLGIYIGRYLSKIYREHLQVVCAPGAGKSDLIGKLIGLLIEGTYEVQGGASGMGLVGKHQSQRIIELFHELDGHYAPIREPQGEDEKIHKMLLGCLSEGFKKYKTTGEYIDPQTGAKGGRQPIMMVSEDTNLRCGNRNHTDFLAKAGGSASAMRQRFTTLLMTLLFNKNRPSVLGSVLTVQYNSTSEAQIGVQNQYNLVQDLFARYHAGMSVGWLPRADVQLYNSLNSLMTAFVATRYPNLANALRSAFTMNGRMLTEVGMHAAWQTLFTPLNPTAEVIRHSETELSALRVQAQLVGQKAESVRPYMVRFAPYNPDVLLPVMAKLYYARYEQLIFVFTEKLFEMTNVVLLEITRHIAERNCRYHVYNKSQTLQEQNSPWPPNTVNQVRNSTDRPDNMPLSRFVSDYSNPDTAIYYLGMPASMRQTSARARDAQSGGGRVDIAYNSFELVPEVIDPAHLALYQTMVQNEGEPFRIRRDHRPTYKREYKDGVKYINPNYVCVQTTVEEYAASASGIFGHYKVDQEGFVAMMKGLRTEFMLTPYLPLIEEITGPSNSANANPDQSANSASKLNWFNSLDRIQSLRYLPEFSKFPTYRVPVLIEHETKNCFYILVSYFETDPYKICTEAIRHITYHATPHRKMILGVPSQHNHFIYEPFTMAPRLDVELVIPGRATVQDDGWLLHKYGFDVDTNRATLGSAKESGPRHYRTACIEKLFAENYLLRNFPEEDQAELLENWSPAGIDRRLAEFYTKNPECLESRPYPQCMPTPTPAVPDGKPLSAVFAAPGPEKRPGSPPSSSALRNIESGRAQQSAHKRAPHTIRSDQLALDSH